MDTDSSIVYLKTDDIYKNIAKDVEKRSDTSNYESDRPLTTGKNEIVIGLMKDELGEKNHERIYQIKTKNYSCLIDDDIEDK